MQLNYHLKLTLWSLFLAAIFLLAVTNYTLLKQLTKVHFHDLIHIGIFSTIVVTTRLLFPAWRLLDIVLTTFIFSMSVEYIQEFFIIAAYGFSWLDVINNILGIWAGVLLIIIKEDPQYPGK